MVKCECKNKPKVKKKKRTAAPKKVQPAISKTKTNQGNIVKNIIIVNSCCPSDKRKSTKRKTVKKKVTPSRPKTEPIMERIEIIEPAKKTVKRKHRNYSPSPLVEYDSSDRPRRTPNKKKSGKKPKIKTNTEKPKKEIPVKKPKKASKTVSVTPFIEVVDYDDGYRGESIKRREKEPRKALESTRASKQTVEVVHIDKEPKKSFMDSYKEFKENRLARRSEKVGRREEAEIIESTPIYYVEESPKSLPAPSKSNKETVLALPSGEEDDLIDISDCNNLSGKNKADCKKRQKIQKKMRTR